MDGGWSRGFGRSVAGPQATDGENRPTQLCWVGAARLRFYDSPRPSTDGRNYTSIADGARRANGCGKRIGRESRVARGGITVERGSGRATGTTAFFGWTWPARTEIPLWELASEWASRVRRLCSKGGGASSPDHPPVGRLGFRRYYNPRRDSFRRSLRVTARFHGRSAGGDVAPRHALFSSEKARSWATCFKTTSATFGTVGAFASIAGQAPRGPTHIAGFVTTTDHFLPFSPFSPPSFFP